MASVSSPKVGNYAVGSQALTNPTVSNGRPQTLTDMGVNTGLTLETINRKLQIESTLDDVFTTSMQDVVSVGKRVMVPNAIKMRLQSQATGARTTIVPFLKAQKGLARMGNTVANGQQKGFERDMNLQYAKFYYNEYSYAIAGSEWGVDFNDMNQFNLFAEIQPQVSKVLAELEGKWNRQALLETYSEPLEQAPVSVTQEWNDNWFIANTSFGSQPTYAAASATFTEAIGDALVAASTGTNGVNANLDLDYLLALEHYAANQKKIDPLMIGGNKRYAVILPSSQIHLLQSTAEGQLGNVWTDVSSLTSEESQFPGIIGRVKNMLIIEDQRYPTLAVTGSDGSWALAATYVNPGNEDSRNTSVYSTSNRAYDIGFLCGANALVDWVVRPLHFEREREEYGKIYGNGAFGERGIQLVKYDIDTETNSSRINKGSIALAFTAPSIVTTA